MATQSIYFNKFILADSYSVDEIVDLLSNYVDNSEKFAINEYDANYIDGLYISSYISKETIFDIETMKYEYIDITRNSAINFSVDIDRKIIEIWGNKTNSQKLIIRLGLLFNNRIIVDSISITIPDIISRLYSNNILIGKVKIEDVVLQDNLIASCVFDLASHERPYDILKKYKQKITQISAIIKEENGNNLTVSIYSSGSIVVYRSKENISENILETIKQICIGGE